MIPWNIVPRDRSLGRYRVACPLLLLKEAVRIHCSMADSLPVLAGRARVASYSRASGGSKQITSYCGANVGRMIASDGLIVESLRATPCGEGTSMPR